jgi:RHS repeat-associated protein
MPTTKGFTGQYSDAGSTGLDYYGARYYDVALGQFTSADTANAGLNRYGYVKGNPETYTDPTGHRSDCQKAGDCGGGSGGGSSNNGGGCHSDRSCGCYSECGSNTSNPNACHLEAVTCQAINNTFHNSNTRIILYMLLQYSVIGWEFLPFILAMGKALGDAYITWTGKNGPAYTTGGGLITIDPNLDGWVRKTNALVHEIVESYYAIVNGVRAPASQRMDYVAQWFAGEFQYESSLYVTPTNGKNYGAYGLPFTQWTKTGDFSNYSSQIPVQPDGPGSGGILPGAAFMDDGRIVPVDPPHVEILDAFYFMLLPGVG